MTITALSLIGSGLNKASQRRAKPAGIDPRKHKDSLVIDQGDMALMRQGMLRGAADANLKNQSMIRRIGAGMKKPGRSVLSNLAGANYHTAKGVATAEGDLQALKQGSEERYFDRVNQYAASEEEAARENAGIMDFTGEMGLMGKAALLWKHGLLTPGQAPTIGGVPKIAGPGNQYPKSTLRLREGYSRKVGA